MPVGSWSSIGNDSDPGLYLDFLDAIEKAPAVRTLESLARIELGAQGRALLERVTTTRISKSGVATTTVRERFTVACVSLEDTTWPDDG